MWEGGRNETIVVLALGIDKFDMALILLSLLGLIILIWFDHSMFLLVLSCCFLAWI